MFTELTFLSDTIVITNSDLNQMTKKGIRQGLEAKYGVSLAEKRDFVNREIEKALSS